LSSYGCFSTGMCYARMRVKLKAAKKHPFGHFGPFGVFDTGRKVESTNPAHGNCNLLKDQTDGYFELVFEFENMAEDLEVMRDRVWNVSGVIKSKEATRRYYDSSGMLRIRFKMNRTAYYIVSSHQGVFYLLNYIVNVGMQLFRSQISATL